MPDRATLTLGGIDVATTKVKASDYVGYNDKNDLFGSMGVAAASGTAEAHDSSKSSNADSPAPRAGQSPTSAPAVADGPVPPTLPPGYTVEIQFNDPKASDSTKGIRLKVRKPSDKLIEFLAKSGARWEPRQGFHAGKEVAYPH